MTRLTYKTLERQSTDRKEKAVSLQTERDALAVEVKRLAEEVRVQKCKARALAGEVDRLAEELRGFRRDKQRADAAKVVQYFVLDWYSHVGKREEREQRRHALHQLRRAVEVWLLEDEKARLKGGE